MDIVDQILILVLSLLSQGQRQYQNEDGTLYMLPVDIALIQDPEFRAWVEYYAENEEEFLKEFSVAFTKVLFSLHF